MATIRNSINLQDRMTPVFRSIIKSMDSTLRVMKNLDRQANKGVQSKAYRTAEKDIKRTNNEIIRMQNNLSRADRVAGKLATSTGKISMNAGKMSMGGLNLTNLASGLYLLKNIANVITDIMETPDNIKAIQYRLETYDTSSLAGSQLVDASFLAAQRSRSELESTANLAARILVSGATQGSGAEAIHLAEIFNKASFLGGSSPGESRRALLQLSQALASGTLQGDELRAIREQAPGLTSVLSQGLSSLAEKGLLPENFIGTKTGDLKALGGEGELTAERVIAAFKEMDTYVNETFENSPKLFGQSITGIVNIWKRWMKLMSEGDNAFARINEKAWQLLKWFESSEGQNFMEELAKVINFVVDAIIKFIEWIGQLIDWFRNLESASNILKSVLIALAAVAVATGIYMAASWIASAWPILLVISLIALVIYILLECGITANEVVGSIAGGLMFLAYLIYDLVIWVVDVLYWAIALIWDAIVAVVVAIINLLIGIGMAIILVIQGILQLIMWVITTIWGAIVTLNNIIYSIVQGAWGIIKSAIVSVYQIFVWLGQGVLGILYGIASAIDWVFGSNLASSVGGWMDGLDKSVKDLNTALDPLGEFEDIGNQWKNSYGALGDMYAGEGKYDDWNLFDNMSETWKSGTDMMGEIGASGVDLFLDPTMLDQMAIDATINPLEGWDTGYKFGARLVDDIGNLDFDAALSDMSKIEDMLNNGVYVDGGALDSIGSIKSDVDISDQDIQLLRDIAARDFLLNLQTITPTANITFGEVRETADVNKILAVIEDMVEEQLATSLVVE